jgi:OOP family OmpA-OmpF porin
MVNNRSISATLLGASAMALSVLATSAAAQDEASRYVNDARGTAVMSAFGLCWRTGSWTPGTTIPGCDPSPAPVAAAPLPAPAPEPAPVAAAPAEPVTPPPVAEVKPEPRAPAPAPMPQKVTLATDALFNFDKAELRPDAKTELDNLLARMRAANVEEVSAVGHTDSIGTDEYNLKLSQRRADAVKSYLVSKGMPAEKIHTEGKGEREPVADNKTKEGRQENRRVDVEVLATSTQPQVIGATPSESAGTVQQ